MKPQLSTTKSTVICAFCTFAISLFIGLMVLAFGPGRTPRGLVDLPKLLFVFPGLLSACVALGHAAGLWISRLIAEPTVSYALRLPVWSAVLSTVGAFTVNLAVLSIAPPGAASRLAVFATCGCVVTLALRLSLSRWMIAESRHHG